LTDRQTPTWRPSTTYLLTTPTAKIWTNQTSVGMRYRKLSHCKTRVQMRYVFLPHIPCVSQQLADALQQRFPLGSAPYRLVGHSLGSQVVIHAATLMAAAKRREVEEAGGGSSASFV
jgi:surfactin synthase thioesterase subunit